MRRVSIALAVLAFALGVPVRAAATRPLTLPFIENDFDKALASAQSSGKPLFVEVWAPW